MCSNYIDLVLVFDASGSIGSVNYKRMLNFARTLVFKLNIDSAMARVAAVTYGTKGHKQFDLKDHIIAADAAKAILNLEYTRGDTNTSGALRLVREEMFKPENGGRPGVPGVVLLITDGESDNPGETLMEARKLRDDNKTILTLGVGAEQWVRLPDLKAIASGPRHSNMYHVGDFNQLDQIIKIIQEATCNSKYLHIILSFKLLQIK